MKIVARIISENEVHITDEGTQEGEGWYEIEREPDLQIEYLRYDPDKDIVTIEPRVKSDEQKAAERKAAEDAALMKPDTIRDLLKRLEAVEAKLPKAAEP